MHANFADLTPDGFYFWMTVITNFGTRAPRPRAPHRSKLLAMPLPDRTPKLNQSDLHYGSNSSAEKNVSMDTRFQAS